MLNIRELFETVIFTIKLPLHATGPDDNGFRNEKCFVFERRFNLKQINLGTLSIEQIRIVKKLNTNQTNQNIIELLYFQEIIPFPTTDKS